MNRINVNKISGLHRSLLALLLLLLTHTAINAQSYTQNEQDCFNLVQFKVAYDNAPRSRVRTSPTCRSAGRRRKPLRARARLPRST